MSACLETIPRWGGAPKHGLIGFEVDTNWTRVLFFQGFQLTEIHHVLTRHSVEFGEIKTKKGECSKNHLRGDVKNRLFITFRNDLTKKFSTDCYFFLIF